MDNLYYGYNFIRNSIWELKTKYPFIKVKIIGKTVNGRDIFAIEVGRADRPKALYLGGVKGNDDFSSLILLKFINNYCEAVLKRSELSGIEIVRALSEMGIAIIPLLNPDGREICRRGFAFAGESAGVLKRICSGDHESFEANARGVDIDRNFDADFEVRRNREIKNRVYRKASRGYSGEYPFSEPESVSLSQYCIQNNFCRAIGLHVGTGEILWRDELEQLPVTDKIAKIFAASSGYAIESEIGDPSEGGFRRWFSRKFNRPAIDVMIKPPKNHFTDNVYDELEEMLAVASIL